jgi:hypothetical protein
VFGRRKRSQYRTTSAIIAESGMLYSFSLLVLIGLSRTIWVVRRYSHDMGDNMLKRTKPGGGGGCDAPGGGKPVHSSTEVGNSRLSCIGSASPQS